jgi:glycine/D-amino acid oxidase-like deaminating enzyme
MSPILNRITPSPALPARADVVVIGAGVIGVTTALTLAERGHSVAVIDKGHVGCEQSSRNWGWVRTAGRDPREIPLVMESQRLWHELNDKIGADTGHRKAGIVYLCETQKDVAHYEAWLEGARDYQVNARMLSGAQMEALLPGSTRSFVGAMHTPEDCKAEPSMATPAIAQAAMRAGVTIHEGCAARTVETKAGRVSAVVTEQGRIDCDAAVVAAGAWSRLFLGNLGIDFPQLWLLGSVLRTKPLPGGPEVTTGASNFAFRKRLDGGYSIARRNKTLVEITPDHFRLFADFAPTAWAQRHEISLRFNSRFLEAARQPRRWSADQPTRFEKDRVLDPTPNAEILDEGLDHLMRAFPVFRGLEIEETWGGMMDATPDAVPVICEAPTLPGLFISSGYSGHGFGIGPGAGRLTADLVSGHAPLVDPAAFHLDRFRPRRTPAGAA